MDRFIYLVCNYVHILTCSLLQRKWKNDAHMAIRDCHNARRIDSSSFRAHYYTAEALEQVICTASYTEVYKDVGLHDQLSSLVLWVAKNILNC